MSVIVPVYNTKEAYLCDCVDSLRIQTLEEIEILLIDDGSNRRTADFLDALGARDSRVKVYHKENGGVSSARNLGIDLAAGEYLAFVDADDWLSRRCLEEAYELAKDRNADLVGWRFVREFSQKSQEQKFSEENVLMYLPKQKIFTYNIFDMRVMGYTWMKLYKRSLIGDHRFRQELKNGEDVEFNFRVYPGISCAAYLNEPYYHYRQVQGSAVRAYHKDLPQRYQATLKAIRQGLSGNRNVRFQQAFLDFTGIAYLMLGLNYIFTKDNPASFGEKIQQMKEISESSPYREMLRKGKRLDLPMTRKVAILCGKYRCYLGVAMVMAVKQWMNHGNGEM